MSGEKSAKALRMAALAEMSGGALDSHIDVIGVKKTLDDAQEEDERNFLETLSGEPKRIWSRRIRRGLTQGELDFIRRGKSDER